MAKDRQRLADQPVTIETLMEVAPNQYKPLGDCTEQELLRAARLRMARLEDELQQQLNKMTANPNASPPPAGR